MESRDSPLPRRMPTVLHSQHPSAQMLCSASQCCSQQLLPCAQQFAARSAMPPTCSSSLRALSLTEKACLLRDREP